MSVYITQGATVKKKTTNAYLQNKLFKYKYCKYNILIGMKHYGVCSDAWGLSEEMESTALPPRGAAQLLQTCASGFCYKDNPSCIWSSSSAALYSPSIVVFSKAPYFLLNCSK